MSSTSKSRPDQIAALTVGLQLPLPPIPPYVIDLVLASIADVWEGLRVKYPKVLASGDESEINALLDTHLNELIGRSTVPLCMYVSSVDRGKETISFDGKHIEMRSDLSFRMTQVDPRFRLTAECKIVDKNSHKPVGLYRENGISRFLNGRYAWGCQEAIMLAYVRCDTTLKQGLLDEFAGQPTMHCISQSVVPHLGLKPDHALGTSAHKRKFKYIHGPKGGLPGSIALWHLWLAP